MAGFETISVLRGLGADETPLQVVVENMTTTAWWRVRDFFIRLAKAILQGVR
jgi:hypothetical protein